MIHDIEKETLQNKKYRHVINTTKNQQLVLMTLQPGEDIPQENHPNITQFIRIEKGHGIAVIEGKEYALHDGISITIPQGKSHYIKNNSESEDLHLYTIYSPPHHLPDTIVDRQIYVSDNDKQHRHDISIETSLNYSGLMRVIFIYFMIIIIMVAMTIIIKDKLVWVR